MKKQKANMTGVLPILKYSSESELNMFAEYDMATKEKFSEYFGFSETEVDQLYKVYQKKTKKAKITREELRIWYDGYHAASGEMLYNPRSVVMALADNGILEKNYYYWQRRVRKETYALISPKVIPTTEPEPVAFAKLPFISSKNDGQSFSPDAVIRRGQAVLELSNTISDRLLDRIMEVVSHA